MQHKPTRPSRPVRTSSMDGVFVAPPLPQVKKPHILQPTPGKQVPRRHPQAQYARRSSGILPGTEQEYMIALGNRASRREESPSTQVSSSWQTKAKLQANKLTTKFKKLNLKLPKITQIPKVAFIAIILIISLTVLVSNRRQASVTATRDLQEILEDNGDTPSSKQPYGQENYAVASDLPQNLIITKLGINARITRLTTRQNSEPKSPQNIYDVGWYENSAKPGETGASLLIGHVRGVEKQGVFYDLTRLVVGDTFQVRLGDGTIRHYYVAKMQTYDRNAVNFQELTQSAVASQPGLNLLSTMASYESNSSSTKQLAVFAVEKGSTSENASQNSLQTPSGPTPSSSRAFDMNL